MRTTTKTGTSIITAVALASLGACTPPPPPKAPYKAEFQYPMPKDAAKIDVTVGVVAPVWSGDGKLYADQNKDDAIYKALVSSLKASFAELLSGKGFNTTGPFNSVDDMTFPEKKGTDFVLYPEIDATVTSTPSSVQIDQGNFVTGGGGAKTCMLTISGTGNVQFLVKEPLSGEKIWVKRLEVSVPKENVPGHGAQCAPRLSPQMRAALGGSNPSVGADPPDEWAKAHVALYGQILGALDKYVNGEEFQVLKKQAAELRAKKVY
jgi:hypothetical protein